MRVKFECETSYIILYQPSVSKTDILSTYSKNSTPKGSKLCTIKHFIGRINPVGNYGHFKENIPQRCFERTQTKCNKVVFTTTARSQACIWPVVRSFAKPFQSTNWQEDPKHKLVQTRDSLICTTARYAMNTVTTPRQNMAKSMHFPSADLQITTRFRFKE